MRVVNNEITVLSINGRRVYGLTAFFAWLGVALTLIVELFDGYVRVPVKAGMFGATPTGWAGAAERIFETLSYFTEWSNILVALVATYVAQTLKPVGVWGRALQLSATMMITVTGIVYATMIAPYVHFSGWNLVTSPIQHAVVPVLMLVAAFGFGPRGGLGLATLARALIVPLIWIVFMLLRGAIWHTYPYSFVNVVALGYQQTLLNTVGILVGGLIFVALIMFIDKAIVRAQRNSVE